MVKVGHKKARKASVNMRAPSSKYMRGGYNPLKTNIKHGAKFVRTHLMCQIWVNRRLPVTWKERNRSF